MPSGLRVRNEVGVLIFDTNDYTCRTLGMQDIGNGTGTIVDDRFLLGTPWAFATMYSDAQVDSGSAAGLRNMSFWATIPAISVSGNTLTWTRNTANNPTGWDLPSARIYYGVR